MQHGCRAKRLYFYWFHVTETRIPVFVSQVSLCAGCNAVHPYAAFVIGIIAGIAYVAWSTVMLRVKVDDPLDAVAGKCHQNVQEFYSQNQSPQDPRYTRSRVLIDFSSKKLWYCFGG